MPARRTSLTITSLLLWFLAAMATAPVTSAQTVTVPADRWMEIDLYWFEQAGIAQSVSEFWDRFAPLYQGVSGYKGIILNIG